MKKKTHEFVLTVDRALTKESALRAILSAFARRQPDGCEFSVVDMATYRRKQHRRIMRACEESRKRMSEYTPEQLQQLETDARKLIAQGRGGRA